MSEVCDANHGTKLRPYSYLRFIYNTTIDILVDASRVLSLFGNFLGVVLPSGVILPLWSADGKPSYLPEKYFYGLTVSLRTGESPLMQYLKLNGDIDLFTIPFPYEEFIESWKQWVKPIDVMIPGTEYWYYNVDGVVSQGINLSPQKQFGVLGDGLEAVFDLGVLYLIFRALKALGLGTFALKLYTAVTTYVKNAKMNIKFSEIDDSIDKLRDKLDYSSTDLEEIKAHVLGLKAQVGVRLLLR